MPHFLIFDWVVEDIYLSLLTGILSRTPLTTTPPSILARYTAITGRTALPSVWRCWSLFNQLLLERDPFPRHSILFNVQKCYRPPSASTVDVYMHFSSRFVWSGQVSFVSRLGSLFRLIHFLHAQLIINMISQLNLFTLGVTFNLCGITTWIAYGMLIIYVVFSSTRRRLCICDDTV